MNSVVSTPGWQVDGADEKSHLNQQRRKDGTLLACRRQLVRLCACLCERPRGPGDPNDGNCYRLLCVLGQSRKRRLVIVVVW